MKDKLFFYFSLATLGTAFIVILYLFYLQLYPFKVVELKRFEVLSSQAKRDQPIKAHIEFDKYLQYSAVTQWSLICDDGFSIGFPRESVYREVGDKKVITYLVIPSFAPLTSCKVQIVLDYTITPFRSIKYVWKSNSFQVVTN